MLERESLSTCKICGSDALRQYTESKDFMVSSEKFAISICEGCGFCFTSPRPTEKEALHYYEASKYLSHRTKKDSALARIYAFAKFFTLRWKLRVIKKNHKNVSALNILDVGCGTGDFIEFCAARGARVAGIEPSESARNSLYNTRIPVFENLNELSNDASYDVITFWHVLEHIYSIDETLLKVKQILKNDGLVFVALPNRKSYDALYYDNFWAALDVPRHLWHFSKSNFQHLTEKHGMQVKKIIPMKLDAYYVSLLSERYLNKRPKPVQWLHGLFIGFRSNLKARRTKEYSSLLYIIGK